MDFTTIVVSSMIALLAPVDSNAQTPDTVQPQSKLEAAAVVSGKEYSEQAHDADDNLCAMVKTATETAITIRSERALDKASGTKSAPRTRMLTVQFAQDLKNVQDALNDQKAAGGRVDSFTDDCDGITAQQEAAMNDEVFRLTESLGGKVSAKDKQANAELKASK